ncbi:MAG: AAA family ATPase [Firmicutes bacterium]|nr:AAA family ATPase [Bacillota bacterium]
MSEIITVLSGKGGTGKTLFTVNMGVHLALKGKKVLIMDTDFGARGVDIALGMESRVIYDMVDVLKGDCRIKQALVENRKYSGLFILEPPVVKKGGGISLIELSVLIDRVKSGFDYIIIDTPAGMSSVTEGLAAKSDKILLVTTQDPVSVRSGQSLLTSLKDRGIKDVELLINKVKLKLADKGYLMDVEDIAESFGTEVCGVIPYDEAMHVAYNNGCAVVDIEDSRGADHLNRVIQRFLLTE